MIMKKPFRFLTLTGLLVSGLAFQSVSTAGQVTVEGDSKGSYHVNIGDKLFTTLHTKGFAKPLLYPVIGPHGIPMTRDYPMKEGTPNEAKDHPHHQSFWFNHGDVNGISFWHLGKDAGVVKTKRVNKITMNGSTASIEFENDWNGPDGKTLYTDRQLMAFHSLGEHMAVDYTITIHASEGDVVFGDTKEGSMGIRSHPMLRIDKGATAINSEGLTGKGIWGKRAKWVDYSGEIDGHTVGFTMMDHPSNPRYPTWWHARDYGLVAANPFGIHDFEKKPAGTGDFKIQKGDSATFKYRVLFHKGNREEAGVEEQFKKFAATQ